MRALRGARVHDVQHTGLAVIAGRGETQSARRLDSPPLFEDKLPSARPELKISLVIPGRAEGANPESITPVFPYCYCRGYGFRIAATRRPE